MTTTRPTQNDRRGAYWLTGLFVGVAVSAIVVRVGMALTGDRTTPLAIFVDVLLMVGALGAAVGSAYTVRAERSGPVQP